MQSLYGESFGHDMYAGGECYRDLAGAHCGRRYRFETCELHPDLRGWREAISGFRRLAGYFAGNGGRHTSIDRPGGRWHHHFQADNLFNGAVSVNLVIYDLLIGLLRNEKPPRAHRATLILLMAGRVRCWISHR